MSDTATQFQEMLEKLRKESYAAGYAAGVKDAAASIHTALATIVPGDVDMELEYSPVTLNALGAARAPAAANLPAAGTTPWYAYSAVKKRQGMTGAEVVLAVREAGHSAAENQIRTALARLENRKLIINRHKKWFLVE